MSGDLNVREETIKLLEESTGTHLRDFESDNDFLDRTAKAQTIKAKLLSVKRFIQER